MVEIFYLQMLLRRLQVLPDRHDIDVNGAQIVHRLHNLLNRLSDTDDIC